MLPKEAPIEQRGTNTDLAHNSPPKVKIPTLTYHYSGQKIGHLPVKNHPYTPVPGSILRVPTTQLAKMNIDLKFVELTADVLEN